MAAVASVAGVALAGAAGLAGASGIAAASGLAGTCGACGLGTAFFESPILMMFFLIHARGMSNRLAKYLQSVTTS